MRHRELLRPRVSLVDHDGEPIKCHGKFNELDVVTLAGIDFGLLDAARGVGDICLAVSEALEASAGTGHSHGDIDSGSNLGELLGHGLGNQIHGG